MFKLKKGFTKTFGGQAFAGSKHKPMGNKNTKHKRSATYSEAK